jgi:hypothetical protein
LNKHGVSLHKYRSPAIGFPTHDDGTVKAIVNGAPLIVLAGVTTQSVAFDLHVWFPRQHTSNPLGFRNSTLGDATFV